MICWWNIELVVISRRLDHDSDFIILFQNKRMLPENVLGSTFSQCCICLLIIPCKCCESGNLKLISCSDHEVLPITCKIQHCVRNMCWVSIFYKQIMKCGFLDLVISHLTMFKNLQPSPLQAHQPIRLLRNIMMKFSGWGR